MAEDNSVESTIQALRESEAKVQGPVVAGAVKFLSETEAMENPRIDLHLTDVAKREAAEDLYVRQMAALRELTGERDASLIPLLIPYIHYTDDFSFRNDWKPRPQTTPNPKPDLKAWAFHWPAFAVIAMTPGSGPILAKYILNPKNPDRYKMHAFEILGTMYPGVHEAEVSGPAAKEALLERIENGEVKERPSVNSGGK